MSSDDTASLIYLLILGGVIAGYAVLANRQRMGQMVRQLMLWGLIFLGVIAGYGLWNDVSGNLLPQQSVAVDEARVEVPLSRDGHYYLTLEANGVPIEFVVDTGATEVVLSRQDAVRAGIDLDSLVYLGRAQTANGEVRSARVRLETLNLGGIEDRNVTVAVTDGEMFGSLLGMSYLRRFDRIEIEDNRLVLYR